jgi:HAD superfamily hydrolase (TIGR01450 family)
VTAPNDHEPTSDTSSSAPAPLGGSEQPLARAYDTALLDLDGVVYVGQHAVPHAATALRDATKTGMRLAYVTNNASRTPDTIAAHLVDIGMPATAEDVVTSAQAAARLLAERLPSGARVLYVGGAGLEAALIAAGLTPVRSADDEPAAVVQGYAPEVGWRELAEATYAVRAGLPYVATNMDMTIPTPRGIAPGNGTLVGVVRAATGVTPEVAGKPELPLHRETILRTGARRPLMVGDRLDTDIQCATRSGTDSLLVFTGVTDPAALLAAEPAHRPTYLAEDLRGLLVPHPRPEPEQGAPGVWRCGGWRASVAEGELVLDGDGDPYDALRALCALAWSRPEALSRPEPPQADKALARAGL